MSMQDILYFAGIIFIALAAIIAVIDAWYFASNHIPDIVADLSGKRRMEQIAQMQLDKPSASGKRGTGALGWIDKMNAKGSAKNGAISSKSSESSSFAGKIFRAPSKPAGEDDDRTVIVDIDSGKAVGSSHVQSVMQISSTTRTHSGPDVTTRVVQKDIDEDFTNVLDCPEEPTKTKAIKKTIGNEGMGIDHGSGRTAILYGAKAKVEDRDENDLTCVIDGPSANIEIATARQANMIHDNLMCDKTETVVWDADGSRSECGSMDETIVIDVTAVSNRESGGSVEDCRRRDRRLPAGYRILEEIVLTQDSEEN